MSAGAAVIAPRARGQRRRVTDLVLLGPGTIGRELLTQLSGSQPRGVRIRVCALIDSTGYVLAREGLAREHLDGCIRHKAARLPLSEHVMGRPAAPINALAFVVSQLAGRPILVDTTAVDTHDMLAIALERGWNAVLANKVPLAAEHRRVAQLRRLARVAGGRILHEATVGAGLPVLDTIRKLREAGDHIHSIEGCPSGTLGFLFAELGRGRSFSAALADAVQAGLTEPDPRVDLSGLDVARKGLILARAIGYRGGLSSPVAESLVPPRLAEIPVDEFRARAHEMDEPWANRVRDAAERGTVLRYRVRATARDVHVGLAAVPLGDPASVLQGTDNQFAFTTARYAERPLVITGPGAGAQVTAAGVYNDVMRLAREKGRSRSAASRPAEPIGAEGRPGIDSPSPESVVVWP